MNKTKKFRFDSFATEFSEENVNDNDSGIGELKLSFTCFDIFLRRVFLAFSHNFFWAPLQF